ncbi:MAG: DUF58 domain-containing protein [Actinomycetota bacterium]|nr:DUF58 domain-containing protein [Actinomycetota bacterium]
MKLGRHAVAPPSVGLGRAEDVLRQLDLLITRRLDGLLQGDYQGFLPGQGSEAGESREYQPGDDVRRMDWNLTARTTVPHVRDLIADRELETWALADCSASLQFGTALCEKRDLAVAAVAAVAFLTARTGNRMGSVMVWPGGKHVVPARAGRHAVLALLHTLLTKPPSGDGGGPTDLGAGIELLLRPPRRRGLMVVVSDFLSPPGWDKALRGLAARHQVLCVEVVDPRELELPNVGYLTLVDPETGQLREVQTGKPALRKRYAEAAAAERAEIAANIRKAGAQHLVLRTDRDWVKDIVQFVVTTRRRAASFTTATSGAPR